MTSVLWFQGGACSGNTMSFINAAEPSVVDLIVDYGLEVVYHPTLSVELGKVAQDLFWSYARGEKEIDIFVYLGPDFVSELGPPVVNIPGCPAHPDWISQVIVALAGNRRVLGWLVEGVPEPGRPADVLLGQAGAGDRADSAGALGGATFRWPRAIAGDASTLYVADAGKRRVLGWTPPPTPGARGRPGRAPDRGDPVPATRADATLVPGQPDLTTAEEFKNRQQGAHRLRFPFAVACDEDRLVVADTSNNRVLVWHGLPRGGAGVPADTVLAQPDMDASGENRWRAVTDDSLCWPYGLSLASDLLAIADSGNNRVMLWTID